MGSLTSNDSLDDVRRAQKGDREAFSKIVMQNQDKIFSMIMRSVGDRSIAEELAQDTFVKAYRGIKKFKYKAEVSTWLVRIALNTTNSYFASRRFKNFQKTTQLKDIHTDCLVQGNDSSQQEFEIKQLHSAIGKLKPLLRDALVLCSLEGISYEEASQVLDVPIGTVRSRVHAAKKALRQQLVKGAAK